MENPKRGCDLGTCVVKRWRSKDSLRLFLAFWRLPVKGGEPEGVRKHLLSKKVFLCSKKVFRRKEGF